MCQIQNTKYAYAPALRPLRCPAGVLMKLKYIAIPALFAALTVAGCGSSGTLGTVTPVTTVAPTTAAPTQAVTVAPVAAATTAAAIPTPSPTPLVVVTAAPPAPAYVAPPAPAYTPPPAANVPPVPAGDGSYTNVDGNTIPDPVSAAAPPAGATAHCNDGTYSFSQHHSGTCSGHGGVAQWL